MSAQEAEQAGDTNFMASGTKNTPSGLLTTVGFIWGFHTLICGPGAQANRKDLPVQGPGKRALSAGENCIISITV